MKSISVHTERSVLTPRAASDVERRPRLHVAAGRPTIARTAGREHRARPPLPATVSAEIQRAYETLASARHLRRYVERLIVGQT